MRLLTLAVYHFIIVFFATRATAAMTNFSQLSDGVRCASRHKDGFADSNAFYQNIALVTAETRVRRNELNTSDFTQFSLESIQGRLWCLAEGKPARLNEFPSKQILRKNYLVQNATLAFDQKTLIVSRHMFLDEFGKASTGPENCFYEHISTGKIYRASKNISYLPVTSDSGVDYVDGDAALIRLKEPVANGTPLTVKNMHLGDSLPNRTPLTVVSNVAMNAPGGNIEGLTIANCSQRRAMLKYGTVTRAVKTDCNTGKGSSGGQVYILEDGMPKLYGLIATATVKAPEGSGYDDERLSTNIVRLDKEILALYARLPN